MGGARAGEVASRTVVELLEDGLPAGVTPEVGLAARAEEANARINELARSDEQRAGMGTTLTAAYVADREVAIAHVGDSRAYRIRDGELERLTRDHSLVNELWERGKITEEEMETHPQRSVITRALGPEVTVEVDSRTYPAKDGDAFLLCSDGLTSMVPETRLAEIVREAGSLEEAGRSLVAEANQRGGRDNITVILFRLEEVDGPATAEAGEDQPTRVERGAAHEVRAAAAAAATTEAVAAEPQTVPERTVPRPARRREPAAAPSNGRRRGGRLMRFGPAMTVLVVMALISAGVDRLARGLFRRDRRPRVCQRLPRAPVRPPGRDPALRAKLRLRRARFPALEAAQQEAARPPAPLQGRRVGPRAPDRARRAGRRPMSARNRELIALIPASLLVTAGFAAVFIQRQDQLSNVSLTYGAVFLGLCVAAHVFLRITLPYADPYLFPLVALLASIGIVMIYRIDETLAREQAQWFVVGLARFALTIVFARDYRQLERYKYVIASGGLALLMAPRLPGIGSQVNGAYLGVKLGPISFQPAEFAKIAIVIFLASYLRDTRQVLVIGARRILGITFPPLKHFGPLLVVWGTAMLMLIFIRDLGSSLMFFGAFLALLYVATNRLSFATIGFRDVPRSARGSSGHRSATSTIAWRLGNTRSTRSSTTRSAAPTRWPNRSSRRPTGECSARASDRRCSTCRAAGRSCRPRTPI